MIYIDQLRQYNKKPSGKRFAHMIASTEEELYSFAEKCGIGKHFYHASPYPHFDVSEERYYVTILNGAIYVNTKQLIRFCQEWYKNAKTQSRG